MTPPDRFLFKDPCTSENARSEFQIWLDAWKRHISGLEQRAREELIEIDLLGGLIARESLPDYLGISRERVGVLIRSGRFRKGPRGTYSLEDVQTYRDERRPGRPSYRGLMHSKREKVPPG